ncbi:uncharacterized protein TrAtP1_012425 [Trichoderma atroviride]|uniref:uncharacterized protein n=1 Tax=Hypocrea atroviridis TaxID=63577 RepID=UPI00331EA778|nr:hypothetical protein TrAtP1_012425 [Trichoderma atroviride]
MPTFGSRQTSLATNPGAPIDGRPALYDVPAQRRRLTIIQDPAFDAHRAFASSSSLPRQKAPESPTSNPARLCIFWHSLALSQASIHCKALQACALVEQQLVPAVCAAAPFRFLHWAKNSQQSLPDKKISSSLLRNYRCGRSPAKPSANKPGGSGLISALSLCLI